MSGEPREITPEMIEEWTDDAGVVHIPAGDWLGPLSILLDDQIRRVEGERTDKTVFHPRP